MNTLDFTVTKILSEEHGPIYKLYGMTVEQVEEEPSKLTREMLYSEGVKQAYEYDCYGVTSIGHRISPVSQKYHVGDKGALLIWGAQK